MRALAAKRVVQSVEPAPPLDNLEKIVLEGILWKPLASKGSMKPGDEVIYFEVDSFLPIIDVYNHLEKYSRTKIVSEISDKVYHGYRIKNAKLRGVPLQGLVMQVEDVAKGYDTNVANILLNCEPGSVLTDVMGVQHYDELKLRERPPRGAHEIVGAFPTHLVPKTDLERIENIPEYFTDGSSSREFYVEEKADGMSVTVVWVPGPDPLFMVCSRNNALRVDPPENGGESWSPGFVVETVLRTGVRENLVKVDRPIAIQGELVGPKIQKNRGEYNDLRFLVFDVYDIEKGVYINKETITDLLELDVVPRVFTGPVTPSEEQCLKDYSAMKNFIEERKSSRGLTLEGMVFKSADDGNPMRFKVLNDLSY